MARLQPKTAAETVAVVSLFATVVIGLSSLAINAAQFLQARSTRVKRQRVSRVHLIDSLARRTLHLSVGMTLSRLVRVALVAYPPALVLGFLPGAKWLVAWLLAFVLHELYAHWLRGAFVERSRNKLQEVNLKLASYLDSFSAKYRQSDDNRFSEAESRSLAVILLQRIHEYAKIASEIHDCGSRTTLAVPVNDGSALRVWCYDDTYDDRRWTELPMLTGGLNTPGAPSAFLTGKYQIIGDMHKLDIIGAKDRTYRTVVSIPLKAGGANGKCVGVLNIDATLPNIFTEEDVEQRLIPLLRVSQNLVTLVLLMRRPNAKYAFEH